MKSSRCVLGTLCCLAMTAAGCVVGEGYGAGVTPDNAEGVLYVYTRRDCNACRMSKPIIDKLKKEGFKINIVDVDRAPGKAGKAGIAFLPTFIHYAEGKETRRIKGTASERELRRLFKPKRKQS